MENMNHLIHLLAVIVDNEWRGRHFANTPDCIMVRASGWHCAKTDRSFDQSFANTNCSNGVILGNKCDNTLEIIKGRISDQDFVIHEVTEPFKS